MPLPSDPVVHAILLLDSYRYWVGRDLVPRDGGPHQQAARLNEAPIVVLSHGTEADPILNYGNRRALELWETDLPTFIETPSRLTAEPVHREERQRLLERVARDGYIDDYSGVRITSTGRRFFIERATVWNMVDATGAYCGQAASFTDWRYLADCG